MSKFKGHNSKWLLKELFVEFYKDGPFTLALEDKEGKRSLYRLYMEELDPTEIQFAKKHLGGKAHWNVLSSSVFLSNHVKAWREELSLTLMAKGIQVLKEVLGEEHRPSDRIQAAKFFANRGWEQALDQSIKEAKEAPFKKSNKKNKTHQDSYSNSSDDYERLLSTNGQINFTRPS